MLGIALLVQIHLISNLLIYKRHDSKSYHKERFSTPASPCSFVGHRYKLKLQVNTDINTVNLLCIGVCQILEKYILLRGKVHCKQLNHSTSYTESYKINKVAYHKIPGRLEIRGNDFGFTGQHLSMWLEATAHSIVVFIPGFCYVVTKTQ